MKRILLSSAAFVAFAAVPAIAADLPVPPVMPMVEPVLAPAYSWTGFYIGVEVGGVFDDHDRDCEFEDVEETESFSFDCDEFFDEFLKTDIPDDFEIPGEDDDDDDDLGLAAGVHVGADWQMGNFVIGVVGDVKWIGFDDDDDDDFLFDLDVLEPDVVTFAAPGFPGGTAFESLGTLTGTDYDIPDAEIDPLVEGSISHDEREWYGTGRLRAGIAAGRALFYATGGVAFGDSNDTEFSGKAFFTGSESDEIFGGADDELADADLTALPSGCEQGTESGGGFTPGAVTDDTAIICSFSSDDDDDIDLGWAGGLGVSFLVTPNFDVGLEWLHIDLGDDDDDDDDDDFDFDFVSLGDDDDDFDVIMLNASFRFGGLAGM
jgi:outer membrane immunogenic protein